MIRIAAVGDLHVGVNSAETLRPYLAELARRAHLLLLAGDVTRTGYPEQAAVLAEDLKGLSVPVVAVLGNHDYHLDRQDQIRAVLTRIGVRVLEGEATVINVCGIRVGIVGLKGFGGGFVGACASEFGEPLMRAFAGHTRVLAAVLGEVLGDLDCDLRLVLLHYAPVRSTLAGEHRELYPFLGSHLLARAIDGAGADLIVHGHAHNGSEAGITPGGIPVYNVAQPVIRRPYALYELRRDGHQSAWEIRGVQ